MKVLKKIINIKPGEGKMVLFFFLFSFFNVAMGLVAKTARDAYFLTDYDKSLLPLMFVVIAVIMAPFLVLFTKLSKKIPQKIFFVVICAIFGTSFIILQPIMTGIIIPITYVWVEMVVAVMIIQYWTIAGESFQPQQAKRLFGIVAGGGSLAVMIIGINLKPFVSYFGSGMLLFLAALFLAISGILGFICLGYLKKEGPTKVSTLSNKSEPKKKMDPFIVGIGGIVAFSAIATVMVDYQFKITASTVYPDSSDLISFFGLFYGISGAISIIMQFFITGPVLSRFGILTGLLILPFFLVAGSLSFLLVPMLMSASFAKFSDQTFKFTINSSSLELLWLPVSTNIRKTAKPQVSGTVKSVAEGIAGLGTFLLVKFIQLQYLSVISIIAIIAWIFTAFKVKTNYVKQLQTAIAKREINFEELNIDVQDAAMVKTIEDTLSSDDEIKQLFALEIIEGLPLYSWKDTIQELFDNGSEDVRMRILDMAWDETDIISDENIISAINKKDMVSPEAIITAGKRRLTNIYADLESFLDEKNQEIVAASAASIIMIESGPLEKAKKILSEMLSSNEESIKATALKKLSDNDSILTNKKLIKFLKSNSGLISNVALTISEKRGNEDLIPAIISNLNIPNTALQARQTLKKFSDEIVLDHFNEMLANEKVKRKLFLGILYALREYPSKRSLDMLFDKLDRGDQEVYNETVDSIIAIARVMPLTEERQRLISEEIRSTAEKLYAINEVIKLLPEDENNFLLLDFLKNEIQNSLPTLLKLGVMDKPETPIESYINTIKTGDPAKLPFLLEFFENIFSKDERAIINPLIEKISLKERSEVGHEHFNKLPNNIEKELHKFIFSFSKWESVIALDYLFKSNKTESLKSLDWNRLPRSNANKEVITRMIQKNNANYQFIPHEQFKLDTEELSMYSTLEKTIILKSVELFKSIPAENLSKVAQITEEVNFNTDEPIFSEGDYGDSLFIVVNGKVKIHKGVQELALLEKGACLGEMALLDDEPRSADATITEESTLFKIEREGFYEVMAGQTVIMQGIIKLLTGRLRIANEKLMSK